MIRHLDHAMISKNGVFIIMNGHYTIRVFIFSIVGYKDAIFIIASGH